MLNTQSKKYDVITQILRISDERLSDLECEQLRSLSQLFFSEFWHKELETTSVEQLFGASRCLQRFLSVRKPGQVLIRAFNPVLEDHGWESPHSIIEVVLGDIPFLVSSLTMELQRQKIMVHQVVHPVLHIERDTDGNLISIHQQKEADLPDTHEAVIRFEIDRQGDPTRLDAIADSLLRVVEDVCILVQDWPEMRGRLQDVTDSTCKLRGVLSSDDTTLNESLDYLRWLMNDHFMFIGCAYYDLIHTPAGDYSLKLDTNSRLGILRFERHFPEDKKHIQLSTYLAKIVRDPTPLIITKSTYRSPIHRPVHMDYLGVKRFNDQGEVIGEYRFFGLFSSSAYTTATTDIPLLRLKVEKLHKSLQAPAGGHKARMLKRILAHYPRDEMLQARQDDLETIIEGMLEAQDRPHLRLFTRTDVHGRFVTVLVMVPKDRFNTTVRLRMERILLETLDGSSIEFQIQHIEGLLTRVQFTIHTIDAHELVTDTENLEARIAQSMLTWDDHLHTALVDQFGEERGIQLFHRYGDALPASYKEGFSSDVAVQDVCRLEALNNSVLLVTSLYESTGSEAASMGFKLYGVGQGKALSDVLPILDKMGVQVLNGQSYPLISTGADKAWMLDFGIAFNQGCYPLSECVGERFQEAFVRVYNGLMDNDGFNKLVIAAGLGWRDVIVLRAIGRYLSQLQIPFSQTYLETTLAKNPVITASLAELFNRRFDPALSDDQQAVSDLRAKLLEELDAVSSLDEDRILRGFYAVIGAILRTNHFQFDTFNNPKSYLSFKLDPAAIPEMPQPCPKYEIFVFSPEVEGVHLRGGEVARGGLRWSDRQEDYRTEVLGLVKAQMVKNAVIVPAGSKGGFVCKRLPESGFRDEIQAEGVSCYQTFIRGLLDLTDNLVNSDVVPPKHVVRYDDDDPYLVVAADKGTATFSDIANSIAEQYGFWLGDAFASGGQNGYDHKKMGITARGAWESVRRLFMEKATDIQNEGFSVVGIGDMSGDVFGNGMLLSRHIHLAAAFNHQHIFIDPSPDCERAYIERERMFKLPRSTWADYDETLISQGGGVFSRSAKRIEISAEMHQILGIDEQVDTLSPNELIRALLKAPVDLLWNGGIGTYVKSSHERDDEVADRANDSVRVNANELRCSVVGEGGNLGLTQQGRIDYARKGGLINTDAIDNSGGVDCSDHEVNIKILLSHAQAAGELTESERNLLLSSMSDEVANLVVSQNYQQSALLSLSDDAAVARLSEDRHLIQSLVREGRLNPEIEFIPQEEALAERHRQHEGLSRPEMSVLLAYSKIKLYDELVKSELASDPYLQIKLREYFPELLQIRYKTLIDAHPLRNEIVATQLTNQITNRMGASFCHAMVEQTQALYADVVRAYTAACELLDVRTIWAAIEDLDHRVPYAVQLRMLKTVHHNLEQATLWLLRNASSNVDVDALIERFRPGVQLIASDLHTLLAGEALNSHERWVQELVDESVPEELAEFVSRLSWAFNALDMVRLSETTGVELLVAAKGYLCLNMTLSIHELRLNILALPENDLWQRKIRASLVEDLGRTFWRVVESFIQYASDLDDIGTGLPDWLKQKAQPVDGYQSTLASVRSSGTPCLEMLSVAVGELKGVG